jgi:CubicO group peptidase (beta-lactamase class C family)
MPKRLLLALVAGSSLSLAALTTASSGDASRVATGYVAHILCSMTFVSGLEPDTVMAEMAEAMPGVDLIRWAIRSNVDRARGDVTVTLFGTSPSRAVYRTGTGCLLVHGNQPPEATHPPVPAAVPASTPQQVRANPALERAVDMAFVEPARPPSRHTKAIVVMKDGQILAERYAPGITSTTPLLGFSVTKSVVNALIGILVRQGRLSVEAPAPIAEWRGAGDARRAITIDQLLRHTSGLAMGSSLTASLTSMFEPVNRMKYVETDMAGYAARSPLETSPGQAWNYHDGNYLLLSRVIRDAAGGHAADVSRLAAKELFEPLGMRDVTLEFDATGTPEGSSQMLASARDWARFGQLYLDDGMVGGRRILPEGWVRYSARPTRGAWVGYGAGLWTNRGDSLGATTRVGLGMPRDAIHARGIFGQFIVIVPSERLVVVRFGMSGGTGDMEGVARLVSDVIAATRRAR